MFRYSIFRGNTVKSDDELQIQTSNHETSTNDDNKNGVSHEIDDSKILKRRGYILLDQRIGEGSYSKVKRGYCRWEHTDVAIKIINRNIAPSDFLQRFLPRELQIIGKVNHPNICRYLEVIDAGHKVYVVMEHAKNGDLLEYVQKYRYVEENLAKNMFNQIVAAIQYLHSNKILHRDLKCENILLTNDFKPLITDFGFAKHQEIIHDLNKTFCGSSAYAPLEILKGIPYDGPSAEVWSLGVVLFIMTTGTMPYDDTNKVSQMRQMKKGVLFGQSRQKLSLLLQNLITEMLNINASARITLDQILLHDWFKTRGDEMNSESVVDMASSSSSSMSAGSSFI